MYIVDSAVKQIINSDFVERFCLCEKSDAALIAASYSDIRPPVTIGRYLNKKEAQEALDKLLGALQSGQAVFYMPDSLLYGEQTITKDARIRRKGGS